MVRDVNDSSRHVSGRSVPGAAVVSEGLPPRSGKRPSCCLPTILPEHTGWHRLFATCVAQRRGIDHSPSNT